MSLDTQDETILRYCTALPDVQIGPDFADVESGTHDDRQHYQAMLTYAADAVKTRPVALAIWRSDRLGRHARETIGAREDLLKLGIAIHSATEGGIVPRAFWNMLAVFAEEQSRVIGDNVSRTNARIRAGGFWKPGRVPWGYTTRQSTPAEVAKGAPAVILIEKPDEAPSVREAFRRLSLGASQRSVWRWLGTIPPTARGARRLTYSALFAHSKNTDPTKPKWHKVALFSNRVYLAIQPGDTPGTWPALVDPETFAKVQAHLQRADTDLPRQASGRYLLSGLLRCPTCRTRMASNSSTRGGRISARYICAHKRVDLTTCWHTTDLAAADAAVLSFMTPVVQTAENRLRRELGRTQAHETSNSASIQDERTAAIAQMTSIRDNSRDELAELTRMFGKKEISLLRYTLASDKAEADYNAANVQLDALASAPSSAVPPLAQLVNQSGQWLHMLHFPNIPERRNLLSTLLLGVTLERTVSAGRQAVRPEHFRVIPHWTSVGEYLAKLP